MILLSVKTYRVTRLSTETHSHLFMEEDAVAAGAVEGIPLMNPTPNKLCRSYYDVPVNWASKTCQILHILPETCMNFM